VTDTPVPQNPLTGASFEYRVEGNTATLSDTRGESKLTYTITLRG